MVIFEEFFDNHDDKCWYYRIHEDCSICNGTEKQIKVFPNLKYHEMTSLLDYSNFNYEVSDIIHNYSDYRCKGNGRLLNFLKQSTDDELCELFNKLVDDNCYCLGRIPENVCPENVCPLSDEIFYLSNSKGLDEYDIYEEMVADIRACFYSKFLAQEWIINRFGVKVHTEYLYETGKL